MSKARDLRELKDDELATRLDDVRQDHFKARFDHATGTLQSSSRLGQIRRDIARIETILRQREIEAAEVASKEGAK